MVQHALLNFIPLDACVMINTPDGAAKQVESYYN